MAFYDTTWYCNFGNGSSTGYYAVTVRPQNTAVAAGVVRRQFTAPAVGSERCFVCIVAGTTANVTDATWVLTRGAKTTDGTATWQECTGASAVNGDLTNTPTWTAAKAIGNPTLGAIIKRNNGASYQICTTAGALGASEPAFSDTAGVTTTESTTTWTSLGPVGNFTGGGAPHARLASACAATWFASGNTIYVGANHAESQATAITITPVGAVATIGRILCHNQSGSYPPAAGDLTTGASISTTAAVSITFNPNSGAFYVYGLTFKAGVGTASVCLIILTPASAYYSFDNCSFQIATTVANANLLQLNTTGAGVIIWNNCTVKFAATLQSIDVGTVNFIWKNTGTILVSGSSVPTGLLSQSSSGKWMNVLLEAVDLSQLTGTIVTTFSAFQMGNLLLKDCKLNASTTVSTPQGYGQTVQLVCCDSGGTAYKSTRYAYEGTETTETSITRVAGAVDPAGQAQSRKIVTTANSQWLRPFLAEPYAIWNSVTAANVTVTVYGTVNAGAVPQNDELWLDIEYLGSSSSPLGTIITTTIANLFTANAPVASDGSSWNGGGSGAGWSPFKLTTTLSSPQPGLAGYIDVRVRAAKASTTYYIDPKIELT